MGKHKKKIQIIVGILVSVLSIYFVFRSVDFAVVFESIRNLNVTYVVIYIIITSSILSIRALRWEMFIPIKKNIRKSSIIAATYIGYMANNVLPAKLGEVVRVYILGEKEGVKKTVILASVVTERLFDLITAVIMLFISILFIPNLPKEVYYTAIVLFIISIIGVCFLVFLSFKRERALKIIRFFLRVFPEKIAEKIEHFIISFVSGIGVKADMKSIIKIISYTIVYWSLQVFSAWILLRAFSLDVSYAGALFVVVITGFGFAIPSAPTGIGPIEAAAIFALSVLSVSYNVAASYAILSHVISIVTITLLGLLAMLITGVDIRKAIEHNKK